MPLLKNKKKPTKKILTYAGECLAKSDHSTQRLQQKLEQKGYSKEEIKTAIQKLEQAHYLDDKRLATRYFQKLYAEEKHSLREIKSKLIQKGLAEDLLEESIFPPEDSEVREKRTAQKLLQKKYPHKLDQEKSYAYLYRKGFSPHIIISAIEKHLLQEKENN